jgi:uncharacterized protein (TIGR02444 family)
MRFWPWALEAYARAGVAAACLELQDGHGQSVPYLLWAAWAAQGGRALTPDILRRGAVLAARWEDIAASPLRLARRGLKTVIEDIADPSREALRAEVKTLELKAEQTLMTALEGLAPALGGPEPLDGALIAAVSAWRAPAPDALLRRLAAALG